MKPLARLLLICVASALSVSVFADAPALPLAGYKHLRWTADEGAPAPIYDVTQGRDGFLWLAARGGVYRFDGVSFERIPRAPGTSPSAAGSTLFTARDGSIWAAYNDGSIAVYRGGAFHDTGYKGLHQRGGVVDIMQTPDGAIWVATYQHDHALLRYQNGSWERFGAPQGVPDGDTREALVGRDGTLWVVDEALLRLRPGARRFERLPVPVVWSGAIGEDSAGRIWLSDPAGTRVASPAPTPAVRPTLSYTPHYFGRAWQLKIDRRGNLWGTGGEDGIWMTPSANPAGPRSRAEANGTLERYGEKDGLTSNDVTSIREDREGNIWAATLLGLDQFHLQSARTEPAFKLTSYGSGVLGASDGTVYVADTKTIYGLRPGQSPQPFPHSAHRDTAMCEAGLGAIWSFTDEAMVRLGRGPRRAVALPPGTTHDADFIDSCVMDHAGNVWVSFNGAGVLVYGMSGWSKASVSALDGERRLLVLDASRRVDVLSGGILFLCSAPDHCLRREGAGDGASRTIYQGQRDLLIASRNGLSRMLGDRIRFVSADRFPFLSNITGIVQTPEGETWMVGVEGIMRMPTAALERVFDDPRAVLSPRIFDTKDGSPGIAVNGDVRGAVRGGDGRLWFATSAGVISIDPAKLPHNSLPPQVAIGSLTAGGVIHRDPAGLNLPAGTSSGEIDFAALSFAVPQRAQVRYWLEGSDGGWVDPGMRRQMFFGNLGPGTYRFHVIAANDDGVWNRSGATLDFTIPPTFLQSIWFKLIVALVFAGLLWALYAIRLRQVTARMRAGLDLRLAERERIARELHDTLLQGFHGLVLRFQSIANRMPREGALRPEMDQALDRAEAVLIEGRDRVRGLRTAAGDLPEVLADLAEEMAVHWPARFELTVEGKPRALHAAVDAEVRYVGEEAIRNAFRHARARTIEAVLTYRASELRFHLRDDGIGLPSDVATSGGRDGHFGLIGMRERAARIGGKLTVSSRPDAGTEIVLSVPASAGYVTTRRAWRWPPGVSSNHWREE